MTVGSLMNMFLRLEMAAKENDSEFLFDTGKEGEPPFQITGVGLDEDGDVCLRNDSRAASVLSATELASELKRFDQDKTVYFLSIDSDGQSTLYNIKDGGTHDRMSPELRMVSASELAGLLGTFSPVGVPHFESGTINFTVNSIYADEFGCLCLESNEIEELDDYTVELILEELSTIPDDTPVYLYDDEAKEYYGIYPDEFKTDPEGDPWINVR